jgi:ferredoxin-NADP reductase
MSTLKAWVHTLRYEALDIISVDLRPMAGETLPAFEAGAHIDLHLPGGLVRSYSLANDSNERQRYLLGILKDKASRGGSRAVHEQLRVGMVLTIGAPRNNFPLHEDADHSVLIAGGIGITPILSMAQRLQALGRSFEVIYLARSRAAAAFIEMHIKDLRFPQICSTSQAALVVFPEPGGPNRSKCCKVCGSFKNIEKHFLTRSHQNEVSIVILL